MKANGGVTEIAVGRNTQVARCPSRVLKAGIDHRNSQEKKP